jgi:hypothetical protein
MSPTTLLNYIRLTLLGGGDKLKSTDRLYKRLGSPENMTVETETRYSIAGWLLVDHDGTVHRPVAFVGKETGVFMLLPKTFPQSVPWASRLKVYTKAVDGTPLLQPETRFESGFRKGETLLWDLRSTLATAEQRASISDMVEALGTTGARERMLVTSNSEETGCLPLEGALLRVDIARSVSPP